MLFARSANFMGGKVSTLKYPSEANPARRSIHQAKRRVFDEILHLDEEGDGFAAVDDPVVVGQREVHHRPDDDPTVHGQPEMIVPTN